MYKGIGLAPPAFGGFSANYAYLSVLHKALARFFDGYKDTVYTQGEKDLFLRSGG